MQRDHMVEILARHSGQTEERVRADIDRDFILRGAAAVAYGLVDHVIEGAHAAAGRGVVQRIEAALAATRFEPPT